MSTILLNGLTTALITNTADIDFSENSIGSLSDVDLTGIAVNKILKWNGSNFVIADLDSATVTEIDGGTY